MCLRLNSGMDFFLTSLSTFLKETLPWKEIFLDYLNLFADLGVASYFRNWILLYYFKINLLVVSRLFRSYCNTFI